MVKSQNCGKCVYFELEDGGYGLCRKNPPMVVSGDEERVRETVWPKVDGDYDWCGEFKAKAAK